jgi:nitroreductase
MEFDEVVRRRRMVRSYDPDRPVPREIVDKIVSHAVRAPSAGFSQGWGFLVLTAPDDRARFWAATRLSDEIDGWLARLRTDRDEAHWPVPYWHIDTGFAALLMHLTAVNEGLGSCFIGLPAETVQAFKEAFGVPAEFSPIGALTVGYRAADKRSPSLRRGHRRLDDVVHHGRWAG